MNGMEVCMRARTVILIALLCTALPLAFPQGRGGQKGGSQGSGQGQGQGQQGRSAGSDRGYGNTDRERDRVHASQQQRDQVKNCDRSADAVRNQARKMGKYGQGGGFNAGNARRDRDQLQEQVRAMQQEHQRLMQGLNPGQQQALESHVRNMNRLQERLNTHMENMNGELGKDAPDGKCLAEQGREMERVSQEWREQYRAIQSKLVIQP
jgi:hypothetical protein